MPGQAYGRVTADHGREMRRIPSLAPAEIGAGLVEPRNFCTGRDRETRRKRLSSVTRV
jgi:hypothetical protein